ncbi:MAG: efflux RND transporter periplasmic adaptor subunit [Verrucomicrobia bacterium]|nr:efflux RND transporter periplasmic adaptor subunit [Verrucomicrobiota bacterium]
MRSSPFLLPALASLVLAAGCKRADPAAAPAAAASRVVNVRVAPIEQSTASPVVRAPGILARQTEADLSFPLAGLLASVTVRPGDRVKAGQELARLQLDPIEAQVAQARAAVEKLQRDLARVEKLQAERVATLENLQDTRTALTQAQAALTQAEFARNHAVLTAPAGGLVLRRSAEPNEIVAAGRPIVSFASEGDGWIAKASLAGRDAARIALGATADLDDGNGNRARGKVIRIAAATDALTRTVPVDLQLDTPPAGARSGVIVSLTITPAPVGARSAVPLAALRDGQGGRAFVFVIEGNATTVKRVAVEVEQVDGDRAYLRSTLPATQQVVISGGQYLNDGTPVKLTN